MIGFDWLTEKGVKDVLSMVYTIVDIIRIVVPIVLIVMTTLDITKKVINPEDKEGQKKIMTRALAALIVFLIPTFINIIFKLLDIDIDGIKTDTVTPSLSTPTPINRPSSTPKVTSTPTPSPTPNTTKLDSLSIINCPNEALHNGDTFTLKTDITDTYTGNIKWFIVYGEQYISLKGTNTDFTDVSISNIEYDTKAAIEISAGGKTDMCKINLESEKLSKLNITNCPSSSTRYNPGDKITLVTDIPSSYNGSIKWIEDTGNNNFKMTLGSDKRSVTLEVIDNPVSTFSTTTVVAGGQSYACLIFINQQSQN